MCEREGSLRVPEYRLTCADFELARTPHVFAARILLFLQTESRRDKLSQLDCGEFLFVSFAASHKLCPLRTGAWVILAERLKMCALVRGAGFLKPKTTLYERTTCKVKARMLCAQIHFVFLFGSALTGPARRARGVDKNCAHKHT